MKTHTINEGHKAPQLSTAQLRRREAELIARRLRNRPLLKFDVLDILKMEDEMNELRGKEPTR
jgi:hypothetical protein